MMKKPAKIKTDLFRFATLRTPQLISDEKKKIGFIFHPAPEKSFFLKKIINITDIDAARIKLNEALTQFTPVTTLESIKQIDINVYRFSGWLMDNRNILNKEVLETITSRPAKLTPQQLVFLWDNLFYQILSKSSSYVRQACLQMIIASNFLDKTTSKTEVIEASSIIIKPRNPGPPTAEEKVILYLKRIANAKVVLPVAFTARKSSPVRGDSISRDYNSIERHHEMTVSQYKANSLQSIKVDIDKHKKVYKKDYRKALELAEAEYAKEVAKAKEEYLKKIKIADKKPVPANANPELLVASQDGVEMILPEFKFKYKAPFHADYLKTLSPDINDYVITKNLEDATFSQTNQLVEKEISQLNKIASTQLIAPKQIIVSNGNIIKQPTNDLYCFTVSFSFKESIRSLSNAIYFSINTGYKRAFFVTSEYTLSTGNDNKYNGKDTDIVDNSGKHLTVKLLPKADIILNEKMIFRLVGTFLLNNGIRLSVDIKGLLGNKMTSGCAVLVSEDGQALEENPLYGVNRVGIADYRKVEQEVCCYIPGEVSHIENILAREYKERHTRNLVSTESILEETSEVEIENQTDTATTERNELQSEVGAVLSEDNSRSYGASTGASGSFMGAEVTADAYADFASSNASSNSNSSAKTYAEEVTLRALERVVQKTTEKRTSRILKEYEENIRHGYDNRTGDKHVTGVFRWVDKIYTNRLVNYGKRLMYEFMVPEPARFYKEAIIKQVESEEQIQTLVEPVHPSDLESPINTAFDINENNYQSLASIYDAQIPAPPAKETTVSKTYSLSPDKKEFSNSYDDIYIPDGYQTKEATGTLNFDWEAKPPMNDGGAKITVTVAGDQFYKGNLEGPRSTYVKNNLEFEFSGYLTQTVPVSISGNKIFTLTLGITALCELKTDVFEQWQNDAYNLIIRSYEEQLDLFNAEQEDLMQEAEDEGKIATGKRFNRTTEQKEIQRICIEMLTQPFEIKMGKNFYTSINCQEGTDIPSVKQTKGLETYSSHVKFFEQAFDWGIMSYIFYPYYWANKCKWIELFQSQDGSDPLFRAFLQSGMARVVVPVRLGFEDAVTYYMETGDIWNGGGLVLDTEDDLYLSIAEEMQEIEGVVEEEWQTTVPTTLTIVQNESVLLDEGGLPCCGTMENDGAGSLEPSSVIIGVTS